MISLDNNPKIRLVVNYVRELIVLGNLTDGVLPTAPALASRLGVSKRTALMGYQYLASNHELVSGRRYRVNDSAGEPVLSGVEDRIFSHLRQRIERADLSLGTQLLPRTVASEFDDYGAAAQFALLRLVDLGYLSHCHTGASYVVRSHTQDLQATAHPLPESLWAVLEQQKLQVGAELPGIRELCDMLQKQHAGVHYLSVRRAEHFLAAIGKLTKLPSGRFTLAA